VKRTNFHRAFGARTTAFAAAHLGESPIAQRSLLLLMLLLLMLLKCVPVLEPVDARRFVEARIVHLGADRTSFK
jgi:hypothetical protein